MGSFGNFQKSSGSHDLMPNEAGVPGLCCLSSLCKRSCAAGSTWNAGKVTQLPKNPSEVVTGNPPRGCNLVRASLWQGVLVGLSALCHTGGQTR